MQLDQLVGGIVDVGPLYLALHENRPFGGCVPQSVQIERALELNCLHLHTLEHAIPLVAPVEF